MKDMVDGRAGAARAARAEVGSASGHFVPAAQRSRPARGEAPFDLNELFYSRTDPRGVILSGNDVFQRVAAYPWDRLVGAPHKIIRHPDMPRAVFHLLWKTIQQGRPIGAYVKNRAADGLHYWVFAAVTPIRGGYLSVRIKPNSPLFATVEREYARLRAAEIAEKLSPENSAARLLERLQALGFPGYEAFMARALSDEMRARDAALGLPQDALLPVIWRIVDAVERIETEISGLVERFQTVRLMPTNMRIAASRIEPAGGPITAISENYRLMATQVMDQLDAFTPDGRPLAQEWLSLVRSAVFLHCVARLQEECVAQTETVGPAGTALSQSGRDGTEGADDGFDEVAETGLLVRQMIDYREKAHGALGAVIRATGELPSLCNRLRRQVVGLDAVRRSCRVENSWIEGRSGGLASIIEQLDAFHEGTDGMLSRITENASAIGKRLRLLERRRRPALLPPEPTAEATPGSEDPRRG